MLDEDVVLDRSLDQRYSWGIIQHEYAHQIDDFLFEPSDRLAVRRTLGGRDWCYEVAGLAHDDHGCERFADVFSWAFWPPQENILGFEARELVPDMRPWQARRFIRGLLS